jgi:uncharacterized alpha-E superfamily protein
VQQLARAHEPAPAKLTDALAVLDRVLPACTALAGFAHDDMTRDDTWRFLMMGRQLERTTFLSALARQILTLAGQELDVVLGPVLEIGNITMTFRARYQRQPELLPIADLLVLDESNPHSVNFQLAALCEQLQQLRTRLGFQPVNDPTAQLQALRGFNLAEFEELHLLQGGPLDALLAACERCALGLSDELTQRFFIHAGEHPQTSVAA